tara:strand:- start:376 stop:618 length:243 start_codon:yes stop_codon:yes gene_type:complete
MTVSNHVKASTAGNVPVTVLYYLENELSALYHAHLYGTLSDGGRVLLAASFRDGKVITAVVEGHVNVLSTLGERLLSADT